MPVPAGGDGFSVLYTSLEAVRRLLGINSVDADSDAMIEAAISAASRNIDARCGRHFYLDATATARTFSAAGRVLYDGASYSLLVDDIGSTAGLLVGGAAWVNTGPGNALAYGRPVTYVSGDVYAANPFVGTVAVTARWGWPAVPPEIETAAGLLASRLYRRKDSPQGVIGSDQWGVTRVARFDPDVEGLIAPYRLPGFA